MKKLRLDLEKLAVASFSVHPEEAPRGTVAAHALPTDPRVCMYSEDWRCSEGYGCTLPQYTCDMTCGGTACLMSDSGPCM